MPATTDGFFLRLVRWFVYLIMFVILAAGVGVFFFWLVENFFLPPEADVRYADPYALDQLFIQWSGICLAICFATFLLYRVLFHLFPAQYGLTLKGLLADFGYGTAWAALLVVVPTVLLVVGGWVSLEFAAWSAPTFLGWLLFFLLQPFAEEVLFRIYFQNTTSYFLGRPAGLWGTALVFALVHTGNDHVSVIGLLNIFCGGLLMGLFFQRTGRLWMSFGLHAAWNFLQSVVLGFAVSGLGTYSLLRAEDRGPDWLTGGTFGLEGSLPALLALVAACVYFWPDHRLPSPLETAMA